MTDDSRDTTSTGPITEPAYFADMALDLHEEPTPERTIDRIAAFAQVAMGSDDAGILLVHSRRKVETAASTSARADRAHELQVEFDEGPCLDALTDDVGSYIVDDTLTDERWLRWGHAVADLGIRSALSVLLQTRARRYGSLNLYGSEPAMFDPDDLAVASIFARHASVALAASQEADGLQRAMDARKVIGIAMGILMERYSVEADRAFDVLQRYSQANNVKLRDVAQMVADKRSLPGD